MDKKAPENSASVADAHHGAADQMAAVLLRLKPVFVHLSHGVEAAQPLLEKAGIEGSKLWQKAQPYHPEVFLPALLGLSLVLAGGVFPTLIAVVEAIRASGTWPGIQSSFAALRSNYQAAKAASDKDDQLDGNKDGVADVKQMPPGALIHRKGLVLLKSINSEQVSDAAQKLATALFAVLATLQFTLAYAYTLGTSLAGMAQSWVGDVCTDAVSKSLPDEARRLAPMIVQTALKFAGLTLALILSKVVYAFYAAMRGSALLVETGLAHALREGRVTKDHPAVQHKAALATAIGVTGFLFQCYIGFQLPFVLRLVLVPVTVAEWCTKVFFGLLRAGQAV